MFLKYSIEIDNEAILTNLKRLTNQIYKLLPTREENRDWQRPLSIIIEELAGMKRLFLGQQPLFFKLLSKLEGLFVLNQENDFAIYRSVIFECLGLLSELGKACRD